MALKIEAVEAVNGVARCLGTESGSAWRCSHVRDRPAFESKVKDDNT